MTWLTWRQFRTQSWIAATALAIAAVVAVLYGRRLGDLYTSLGVADCTTGGGQCSAADLFVSQAAAGWTGALFGAGMVLTYVAPALIGAFWGAPLVARELETGTYRLVWNQSVTPRRWLAVKVATLGLTSMAVAGLLSLAVTWSAARLDQVSHERLHPVYFGARGVVPIGYAAFGFALGVLLGMVIRRTVPAMAATLGGYIAALVVVREWVRPHLLPATHASLPLTADNIHEIGIGPGGHVVLVGGAVDIPDGAWVLSDHTTTAAGAPIDLVNPEACGGPATGPRPCMQWLATQNLREQVTYQPASHFWPLQWMEAGLFTVAAIALVGFTFWWLGRRTA